MAIGVDVFEGNGSVNWKSAKDNGNVSFALVRAAEATLKDPEYGPYTAQCAAEGIPTSAYTFLHWTGYSPESQGATLLDVIGASTSLKKAFPPTIDVEFPEGRGALGITASQARDVLERCVRVVRDGIGVWPMLYTSRVVCEDPDGLDNVLAGSDLGNCPLWIKFWPYPVGSQAVYATDLVDALSSPRIPLPWLTDEWLIQQYQGDAVNLLGFTTKVDMNRVHVIRQGSTGGTVKLAQRLAGELVVDGSFGPKTTSRIRELQLAAGLAGDGIVGLDTWPILLWKNT